MLAARPAARRRRGTSGAGRPVLVLPGFGATDRATGRLRAHLDQRGWTTYAWGVGPNHGLTDEVLDGVLARFDEVYAVERQPVDVVGWSFGGLLARWVAHERPTQVRSVVTLGSPWRPGGRADPDHAAVRARAAYPRPVRARREGRRRAARAAAGAHHRDLVEDRRHRRLARLPGRGDRRPPATSSVPSSHLGLASNPFALAALTRALRSRGRVMAEDLEQTLRETDLDLRDPTLVATVLPFLRLVMKRWFRTEVRDIERVPAEGGVLIVSNHSGGLMPMDVPIIAVAFHDQFGAERPLYTLAHDMLFTGSIETTMRRAGFVEATRENAAAVLERGAVTIVFPGGDYDSFRPTLQQNVIDFAGRTGYVRTALAAGVPIVPVVSIGGQEQQLFLWRGELLAKLAAAGEADAHRLHAGRLRLPVRPHLRVPAQPAAAHQDRHPGARPDRPRGRVRRGPRRRPRSTSRSVARMQVALDELAKQRRFPVLG